MKRILVVEDEESLRETLVLNLELEGYEPVGASSGIEAAELLKNQHFDLAILDIMLPGMNGLELCTSIRISGNTTPILMLTARDSPEDRIEGLRTGADDYLGKPFHLEELLLRIRNLLRRTESDPLEGPLAPWLHFGENTVDFQTFEATTPRGTFSLTKKECALLRLLSERPGEVVSRSQILQIVWGYDVYPSTRTIDNFILNFRKHFEEDPKDPKHFHSVRGVGYRFTP